MLIDAEDAIKLFFPNSSLEMVFLEAIANSLDANASMIKILINIDKFDSPRDSLTISIEDNGDGFTEQNFTNFSKTGKRKDLKHKGVGRVVFLNYFRQVKIESIYGQHKREFIYDSSFTNKSSIYKLDNPQKNSTKLVFSGFSDNVVHSYSYLIPEKLGERIMLHFLLRLYDMQNTQRDFCISIGLNAKEENPAQGFVSGEYSITPQKLTPLKHAKLDSEDLTLFNNHLDIFYFIRSGTTTHYVTTGIEIDGRTAELELIDAKMIPAGHQILFLARSEYFTSKIDMARTTPKLSDSDSRIVKRVLQKGITKVLSEELPAFREKQQKIKNNFSQRYPFLTGYFEDDSIGLVDENKSLIAAQNKFLNDQKSVLEADALDDELYEKSLNLSSRVLTQYILYRNFIIQKLKSMNPENSEEDIHNLILPKRKIISSEDFHQQIYNNNVWLLDDKYMSFSTILSDEEMYKLIDVIAEPEELNDTKRPDIAIVFSRSLDENIPVDVVIVELKKKGASLDENVKVTTQLWQRAKKLLQYYQARIQRIWFYGVISIDNEFSGYLKDKGWKELFSLGNMYYLEEEISVNNDKVPVGYFLMPYDSLLADAKGRNETFLKILKESIRKSAGAENRT